MSFDGNHHPNPDIEHFPHPRKSPHTPFQSTPLPPPLEETAYLISIISALFKLSLSVLSIFVTEFHIQYVYFLCLASFCSAVSF